MKNFRVFTSKMPIGCMIDYNSVTGEYRHRNGTVYEIEFWLYKFSISFAFTWWHEVSE